MGDLRNLQFQDTFIRDVVEFVAADDFQTKFENFFLDNAEQFSDEEEHKLMYYELYQNFQTMFEGELEKLCRKKNMTQQEFHRRCNEASEQDANARHYIQILLSSAEYDTFVRLMKLMKPIAMAKKASQADAKHGPVDDDEDDVKHCAKGHDAKGSVSAAAPKSYHDHAPSKKGDDDEDEEEYASKK